MQRGCSCGAHLCQCLHEVPCQLSRTAGWPVWEGTRDWLCHSALVWGHGQRKPVVAEMSLAGVLGDGREDLQKCGNEKWVSVKILPVSINLLRISNTRTSKWAHSLGGRAEKYWDVTDTTNSCFAVLCTPRNLPVTPKETVPTYSKRVFQPWQTFRLYFQQNNSFFWLMLFH